MHILSSCISAYAQPWYLSCSETVGQGTHASFMAHMPSSLAEQSLSLIFLKASRDFSLRFSQSSWAAFLGAGSSYVKLKNSSAVHPLKASWVRDVKTVHGGNRGGKLSSSMGRALRRKEEFSV